MAIIETPHSVPFGAVSFSIVNGVDSFFSGIVGAYRAHKTEKTLRSLSNAQLEDIGLERADLHTVAQRALRM